MNSETTWQELSQIESSRRDRQLLLSLAGIAVADALIAQQAARDEGYETRCEMTRQLEAAQAQYAVAKARME